ncbi:MAG: hypothetical protein NVSMB39_1260 [Candidatus Saccharimonadales bacterium]
MALVQRHRLLLVLAGILFLVGVSVIFYPRLTAPIDSYAACVEAGYPVTQSDPPVCRENSRNFLGTPVPAAPAAASAENVSFDVLVDGDTHSSIPGHEQHLLTTPALWDAYWSNVHGGLATLPPLLPVDFTKNDALGVSLGQEFTNGYSLKITGITSSASGTLVSITEFTPTITCSVTKQISNPYVIVRSPKLVQPVSFRITPEKRHC